MTPTQSPQQLNTADSAVPPGSVLAQSMAPADGVPWWRLMNRYHWFVLIVAALGWLFDCLDQQLFTLARVPALKDLLQLPASHPSVKSWGGWVTSVFLIGWATGGLFFGVLGDRIGRAKTMMITILMYSLCTGLSSLSVSVWDFAFYRFITGLGVGGEFAVGVALVAEVMPTGARARALALLQALSAVGNVSAALISMGMGHLEQSGIAAWRIMFLIGALPAMLALIIRRRLKEPERWQAAAQQVGEKRKLGSYAELFRHPKWRRHAIIGLLLASSGVIGLWGIGFFSADLSRAVFRKHYVAEIYAEQIALASGAGNTAKAADLTQIRDAELTPPAAGTTAPPLTDSQSKLKSSLEPQVSGRLTTWAGITLLMQQVGAFAGMYTFGWLAQRIGRRPTFAIAFLMAMLSTALVFWRMNEPSDVFWMIPLMGFFQLSLFAGYAIYFPELFPTYLRSTGTSFCYNVGRFVAASGPAVLGLLTGVVFAGYAEPLPWRYAGVSMCGIFLLGLVVLPFAPETKGQPLPEDEVSFAH
jgi:MFS family permease